MRTWSGCLVGLLLDAARELHVIGFAMVEVVTRMKKAFNSLSLPNSHTHIGTGEYRDTQGELPSLPPTHTH